MGTGFRFQAFPNMKNLFIRTPIEHYSVLGREVFVKRDDLFGVHPAPPLGKLRGLEILLQRYHEQGVRVVGCWDTRVSKLGQGLAALVTEFSDMRAVISYPTRRRCPIPNAVRIAESLGSEILPLRGNHASICYAQATKLVAKRGGIMLPFGLECTEAVSAIADEAASVPANFIKSGTVVVCCGSGVTLAGLLLGLLAAPRRLIGISSGRSIAKILACVSRHVGKISSSVDLHPARVPYDQSLDYFCPFPSHPNYDLKAWKFLVENVESLHEPILFWNVGA
jgi:1-aminocyclopropane-1-carboxylate deaminase/D-cysteine desulfhydrase-like pyridoxal-dependent ACC family enzyme